MTAVAHQQEIALDAITIENNPRDTFDKKGEKFKALVASVKKHGIITPVTVETRGTGGFGLIAGQRRVAAAKAAGLKTIPALVRSPNGNTAAMAVSENIHREALSPIQEGKAFQRALETMSEKEVAAAYSVSPEFIRGRLRLLKLPPTLAKGVDRGEIPLGAASLLASIAEHSEPLAKAIADELGSGKTTLHELINQTGSVINNAVLHSEDKHLIAFPAHSQFLREYDIRGFSQDQLDRVYELYELRPRYQYAPLLSDKDVDAARAYGCLLIVVDGFGRETQLITDAAWLYEHLEASLVRLAQKGDEERAQERKRRDPSAPTSPVDEGEEQRRQQERAELKRLRIAAIHRNLELGEDLAVKAKTMKVDKDVMSVLGQLILDHYGTDLFLRGFRYTWPEGKTVEPAKSESAVPKVERISTREEADREVRRLWERCKTPQEMAGLLIQLIVAARYADQSETANNDRRPQPLPWLADWGELPTVHRPSRGSRALDRIASHLVPRSTKQWVRDAKKRQEEKRAADEERARAYRAEAGLPEAGADFEDEDEFPSED